MRDLHFPRLRKSAAIVAALAGAVLSSGWITLVSNLHDFGVGMGWPVTHLLAVARAGPWPPLLRAFIYACAAVLLIWGVWPERKTATEENRPRGGPALMYGSIGLAAFLVFTASFLVLSRHVSPTTSAQAHSAPRPVSAHPQTPQPRHPGRPTPAPKVAGDITWMSESYPQYSYGLLWMQGETDKPFVIMAFTDHARSNVRTNIRSISDYVILDKSGKLYPIYFNVEGTMVDPKDVDSIPPGAVFDIIAPFVPRPRDIKEGIQTDKFIKDFTPLTFVFNYDGKKHIHTFSAKEVTYIIEDQLRRSGYKPAIPSIVRKAGAGDVPIQ